MRTLTTAAGTSEGKVDPSCTVTDRQFGCACVCRLDIRGLAGAWDQFGVEPGWLVSARRYPLGVNKYLVGVPLGRLASVPAKRTIGRRNEPGRAELVRKFETHFAQTPCSARSHVAGARIVTQVRSSLVLYGV